jgi:hypothetical protein
LLNSRERKSHVFFGWTKPTGDFRQVFPNFESKKRNYRDDEMKSVSYDYAQQPT